MIDWNQIRQRHNLFLTEEQRQAIRRKLPPSPGEGVYFADGVFEGGGVLGTAFLGAVRCCSEVGIRWKGLAGTSAGAITAALLAADLSVDDLEQALGQLDFLRFLRAKTSWLIQDRTPEHDLDQPGWMLARLLIAGQLGQFRGQPFHDWLGGLLAQNGKQTFGDIGRNDPDRRLKVVISDLTLGQMRLLPDDLPIYSVGAADFPIADAVRLSMSIPFFFEPGRLGSSVIVDGGILSNYPLWIFDVGETGPGDGTGGTPPPKPPAWPTFGFRLVDKRSDEPAVILRATDLLGAMVKTMMVASDRHYMSLHNRNRTIDIDITPVGVTATQFNLDDNAKAALYRIGYESTRDFLLKTWSWDKHLASRGFAATKR
jgi:NTE family protein